MQDSAIRQEMRVREVFGGKRTNGGNAPTLYGWISPPTEPAQAAKFPCSSTNRQPPKRAQRSRYRTYFARDRILFPLTFAHPLLGEIARFNNRRADAPLQLFIETRSREGDEHTLTAAGRIPLPDFVILKPQRCPCDRRWPQATADTTSGDKDHGE